MELIFDPINLVSKPNGTIKLKDGPAFNVYESVRSPEFNVEEPVERTYWETFNDNLYNIINKRKSTPTKKSNYVEVDKEDETTNKDSKTTKSTPEWANTYVGNAYDKFKKDFTDSLQTHPDYNTKEWERYLTDLAFAESSFNADSLNQINAKGYFQLMPSNRKSEWNDNVEQFDDMYKLTEANIQYFNRNATSEDKKRMEELGIDIYGWLAGAHLGGARNALKALRGQSNHKDDNGTDIMSYFKRFTQK